LTLNHNDPIRVGEIVVYSLEGRDIPIVHRVLAIHETPEGTPKFLTKGDNNIPNDRGLYNPGQLWLEKHHIIGRAKGFDFLLLIN
jgi:signal peptidase